MNTLRLGVRGVILAFTATAVLLVSGCAATDNSASSREAASTSDSSQAITPPIAVAWFYLSDDYQNQAYNSIPAEWKKVDFADVDVLYVGPAGIQDNNGTFGLYNSGATGNLANRFTWVAQTARTQNPNIKIIVSQWWGSGSGIWGNALSSLTTGQVGAYTKSVAAFVKQYGIDGYDVDYESNNVTSNQTAIAQGVREQLADLGKATGQKYYQTVSPSVTQGLNGSVPYVDFLNMQTYAGGSGLTVASFTGIGYKASQLLYGYCPETNCGTQPLNTVEQQYTNNKLAGIHLWRLNSDNYVYEGQQQAQTWAFLHPDSPNPTAP